MRGDLDLSFVHGLPQARRALGFASESHRGQQRAGDRAAFLAHLAETASLLARSGYRDEVVAAAVLHDVLEKTSIQAAAIEDEFGSEVAALVQAVSDDPAIAGEEERKAELRERVRRAGGDAAAVYASDKVSKVRELRIELATGGDRAAIEARAAQHRASLEMLEAVLGDTRLTDVLRFELEVLEQLPPS